MADRQITKDIVQRMYPYQLVQTYMLASYAYYQLGHSPMTDTAYDHLCVLLDQLWETFEHPHKHLIDRVGLKAGTGYYLSDELYPRIVVNSVDAYLECIASGEYFKIIEPHLMSV